MLSEQRGDTAFLVEIFAVGAGQIELFVVELEAFAEELPAAVGLRLHKQSPQELLGVNVARLERVGLLGGLERSGLVEGPQLLGEGKGVHSERVFHDPVGLSVSPIGLERPAARTRSKSMAPSSLWLTRRGAQQCTAWEGAPSAACAEHGLRSARGAGLLGWSVGSALIKQGFQPGLYPSIFLSALVS